MPPAPRNTAVLPSRRPPRRRGRFSLRGIWALGISVLVVAALAIATALGGVSALASSSATPAAKSQLGLGTLLNAAKLAVGPTLTKIKEKPSPTLPDSSAYKFDYKGVERYFRLHLAGDQAHAAAKPLILVLPGWRRTARDSEDEFGFDTVSNRQGFNVAYVDGVHSSWDAGTCCGYASKYKLPDVTALHTIVDAVAELAPVDRRHVTLAGFSNGGMLAYRAACSESAQLAGIIVAAASLQVSSCHPGPLTIVAGHGARDGTVPIAGVHYSDYLSGPVTSQANTFAPFLAADACKFGHTLKLGRYAVTQLRQCTRGVTVDSYIDGLGGHAWLGTVPGGRSFASTAYALLAGRPSIVPFAA